MIKSSLLTPQIDLLPEFMGCVVYARCDVLSTSGGKNIHYVRATILFHKLSRLSKMSGPVTVYSKVDTFVYNCIIICKYLFVLDKISELYKQLFFLSFGLQKLENR